MTRWKLSRQAHGGEEFTILEGEEVTVGRGVNNKITLSSIVVSRNHCVLNVQREKVLITDLKSSNGVYVGTKKIPQNTPYILKDSDVIGFGWTSGAPVVNIGDNEKFMFKLSKERFRIHSLEFQSDTEVDNIEAQIAAIDGNHNKRPNNASPVIEIRNKRKCGEKISHYPGNDTKPQLKRKPSIGPQEEKIKIEFTEQRSKCPVLTIDDDIIHIPSDSNNEEEETIAKKPKLETVCEELDKETIKEEPVKTEREDLEYEAFNVKQEYLGYNDEPIQIDSDSDRECEQWMIRLSQSSPGKPLMKVVRESQIDLNNEESSYSQLDDFVNDEDFVDDLISIPPVPPEVSNQNESTSYKIQQVNNKSKVYDDDEQYLDNLISLHFSPSHVDDTPAKSSKTVEESSKDEVDGGNLDHLTTVPKITKMPLPEISNDNVKKAQMIDPLAHSSKRKSSSHTARDCSHKSSSSRHSRHSKHSSSKRHSISNSQKEERKKKLKDIATREKDLKTDKSSNCSRQDKSLVKAKVTTSNRGAFLTDVVQGVVKPMKRKESPDKSIKSKGKVDVALPKDTPQLSEPVVELKKKQPSNDPPKSHVPENMETIENRKKQSQKDTYKATVPEQGEDIENRKKQSKKPITEEHKKSKRKDKHVETKSESSLLKSRVPLKSLKPLSETEESFSGRPFSKVEPLPPKKPKKKVRFSDAGPQVHMFEIEEGNKMKKTSSVKTIQVEKLQKPIFTLERITLSKVLGWNPQWLEEQINKAEPPPILGHNSPPMTIFHSFTNHNQYVQLVGDLLLMEIWECLTQGYMRKRGQSGGLQLRIASLPPPPPAQERYFELFNLSVDLSVPNSEIRTVPRMGEVMIIEFGPENARNRRFFYVHNVRSLPSPPNNIYAFFTLSLQVSYTEKMKSLRLGEMVIGRTLAYINKEITLFEAMEYLARSPLNEAILRPDPLHYLNSNSVSMNNIKSEWTKTLNPSQQLAVSSSVSAALSDRPGIQMVQGPPGTGKSGVICAIVMSYFYDSFGRKQQNRGKILICATSNAAVDELVIRLLNIRQTLPRAERFRMVRVGREEAMNPRAHDVCSQELAKRDAARAHAAEPAHQGLSEEIAHLEAKVNMWKTQAQDAERSKPERVAYCKGRVKQLTSKLDLLRSGGGGSDFGREVRAGQLVEDERRIIELADIVVTTLASACNHKMRGLKGRIALCIVDEAGQAIEPETLIPLTLDVTRMTLIGDPQQLPGYICSQRAKKHGLGESLFSRLASCAEHWPESPVVLLNEQYRMHPDIADYPNHAFYAGRICTVAQNRPDLCIPPYSIVGISSGDKGQGVSGANEMEAWGVSRLVVALSGVLRACNLKLAVITPYNAHKELIKKNLKALQDSPDMHVEVNTVDSFQGQERDVVVVSLARSQGVGFLTDAGRMNVMLTRAKHALIVCLNPHAMLKNYQWRTLVDDAHRRNMYKVLPNRMCQPASANISNEEILQYVTCQSRNHK